MSMGPIVIPPPASSGPSWTNIRNGVATLLQTIGSLTPKARTPVTINDDVAIVEFASPGIMPLGHSLMVEIHFRIIVIVNRATVDDSESVLDDYLWPSGVKSIVAAINADRTLGGAVDDCSWVSSGFPYGTPEGYPTGRQSEVVFRCAVNLTYNPPT